MRERLYLDCCILNRLGDDQSQERIRTEAEAAEQVLHIVATGAVDWIASSFLHAELARNPDVLRRDDALDLLELATEFVTPTRSTFERGLVLRAEGYGEFDALHLAIAEEHHATTLLTVDARFLKRAGRRPVGSLPAFENPINWWRRRKPWLIQR
jgi:predicted nucleic acid-binding protein